MKMFQSTEAYLKVEFDVEKEFLSSTVTLTDGTTGKLFSRGLRSATDDIFTYHCHLCHVVDLVGEKNFRNHTAGRKHRKLLNGDVNATKFNVPLFEDPKLTAEANLGDPLGDLRRDMEPDIEFQTNLEATNQPMLGLEYIFELRDLKSHPSFVCILCNSKGNSQHIIGHLVNQIHRVKYLQKHFPTLLQKTWITPECQNDATKRRNELLDICYRVEVIVGRSDIEIRDFNNFDFSPKANNNRANPKPLGRATKATITQLILSSDSEVEFIEEKPEPSLKKKKTLENRSRSPCRWSKNRERDRERLRLMSPALTRPRRLIPKPTKNASKLYIERYKRDEFRFRMEMTIFEMELDYREYKLNPHRHPNYNECWVQHWNKHKFLMKNVLNINYRVREEWLEIFYPIMEKLHNNAKIKVKLEYKTKLKLPPKSSLNKIRYENLTTRSHSPVVISDDEDCQEKPSKRPRVDSPAGPSTSAQATATVTSETVDDDDDEEDNSPNCVFYEKYCPELMASILQPTPATDDDPITLKTVCRLLIDFNIYLGHLPSLILMIFAQCLFLEKKDLHAIDEILLTQYNCDILHRLMESIQNRVASRKTSYKRVQAAKRLITKITILVQKGEAMRKSKGVIDPEQPDHPILPTQPFEYYEGTDYHKLNLSDKITVGLASKGNTLITQDDVAELINNFKLCRQLNQDQDQEDDQDHNKDQDQDQEYDTDDEDKVDYRDDHEDDDEFDEDYEPPYPQVNAPELQKNDKRIAYFIHQVRVQSAGQIFTDNNIRQLTRKFKTLPKKVQNFLMDYIKTIDEDEVTNFKRFELKPVEIHVQQLTIAPEEIPRSMNHAPLAHVNLDLAPEALQVEELVEEILQFENIAAELLRDDDNIQGSEDDISEVQIIENETPEPVEIDDTDDDALEVEDTDDDASEPIQIEDSDDEILEQGDELDEEAFMVSDEELDDGAVDNPDEQEVQGSDGEEDSNAEIKDSEEDSDTDMEDDESDHMDAEDDEDDDMEADDNDSNHESGDDEAHEPTHEPADEPDDDDYEEQAEEEPEEDVEQAEQPAVNEAQQPAVDQAAQQPAVDQAAQAKEASKDSGEETDDNQPKESDRNYHYDSNDDGYDDAEVIAKMVNLTTFEGPPMQPQSFAMPLPSTSAPPKSLLYSLRKNMKKAFNAPQTSKDYSNGCQLQCNQETAEKLNYPYQNSTPIFRCKKPRFEEMQPNMFNATIDSAQRHIAQTKANDMYFHHLHKDDEVNGVRRNKKR